jgi:hypothetical protein
MAWQGRVTPLHWVNIDHPVVVARLLAAEATASRSPMERNIGICCRAREDEHLLYTHLPELLQGRWM